MGEQEPNNTWREANALSDGCSIAQGALETRRDEDWYAVTMVAGQMLIVSQDKGAGGAGGWLPEIELIAPDGTTVLMSATDLDGEGPARGLTYQAAESGTYYLRVSTQATARLAERTYQLDVCLVTP
jgi:hypothetical protein